MAEIVPFYATETEHKSVDTLPTQPVKVESLLNAVPKFHDTICGNLLVQWALILTSGTKELVCEYHIYKRDRKEIFDQAQDLLKVTSGADAVGAVAEAANADLAKHPWWPDFEKKLIETLSEHFKGVAGRVGYHEEVDSWSVSMHPENMALGMWLDTHLNAFAAKLWAKIEG